MSIFDTLKAALSSAGIKTPGSGGSVLGIDIGSASIKIVQLRRENGRAVLETYGAITLGPYAQKEAGRVTNLEPSQTIIALKDLIRESNISTRSAAMAIPFTDSLTSIVEMPNMSKDQLNKMIPLEARKYIPVPVSEVTMDWFIIPQDDVAKKSIRIKGVSGSQGRDIKMKTKQDMVEVLLVAIHNKTLNEYQSITSGAELAVAFYELEIFSASRSILGHATAPVMIVDIGASATKIYIIENGVVRLSHLVSKGSQDLTLRIATALSLEFKKAERLKQEVGLSALKADGESTDAKVSQAMLSTLDHIFAEVNRVLLSYGKKYHKNIGKVIFSGGSSVMTGFIEYADTVVDNTVEVADPFTKVQTPAFLNDVLKEVGPEFAVATGLALRQLHTTN